MEEAFKGRLIVILSILVAIFFIGTVGSCSSAGRMKSSRDKEMASRLDLEEKVSKILQDKVSSEERLKAAGAALETEKAAHEADKKALLQEQLVNQSLKEELNKVTKLKEALEEDLKEALVPTKKAKK
jgi:small-conductance mechanosensitive channel